MGQSPLPHMHLEEEMWVPDDVESFTREHEAIVFFRLRIKRKTEYEAYQKVHAEESQKTSQSTEVTDTTNVTEMTEPAIAASPALEKRSEAEVVSSTETLPTQKKEPNKPRISAKMRLASRQEFHDTYLVKVVTKNGSPVTIASDVMKRLYRICQLSGDHRACPTYLVNNILLEVIEAIEAEAKSWGSLQL